MIENSDIEEVVDYPEASDVMMRFESYKASGTQWRNNISEDMSFITPGGMWTSEQVAQLEDRGHRAFGRV